MTVAADPTLEPPDGLAGDVVSEAPFGLSRGQWTGALIIGALCAGIVVGVMFTRRAPRLDATPLDAGVPVPCPCGEQRNHFHDESGQGWLDDAPPAPQAPPATPAKSLEDEILAEFGGDVNIV